MTSAKLRIGLIGAGRRGQSHMTTIKELPELYELAAVCDVSESARAAAEAEGVRAYAGVNEFFQAGKLDAVIIATRAETHHVMAKAAAEHGVPMLMETPMGTTRAMMDFIGEAAAKAGVPVEVGENMWRRPTEHLNQQVVRAGLIGKVLRVSSYYESAGDDSCYHTMSLLRVYAGADVEQVQGFAHRSTLDPSVTQSAQGGAWNALSGETWTQAVLFYANGVIGSCTYITQWTGPLRRGHPRFMSVEGTEGFVVTGDGDMNLLRQVKEGVGSTYPKLIETSRLGEGEVPLRYYYETEPLMEYVNPFGDRVLSDSGSTGSPSDGIARANELVSLHRLVTEGGAPDYTIEQARRDQELSIAITESARLGRPLRTDELSDETPWEKGQHEEFRKRWGADPFKDVDLVLNRSS